MKVVTFSIFKGGTAKTTSTVNTAAVLETDRASSERLYASLRNLPVTESFGTLGYTLHDLTRSSILINLREHKPTLFFTYNSRAHRFFIKDGNSHSKVETIYHLLAGNAPEGLTVFRQQMWAFRSRLNYAAANNLIRNGEELAVLGVVDNTIIAELERQKYLIAADVLRRASVEKSGLEMGSHLVDAIKLFSGDTATSPKQISHSHSSVESFISQRRGYVEQKLNDAKGKQDDLRQGIWLDALAAIDREEEQFEAALNRHAEARALDPNDSLKLASRGATYRGMGRYDEALADFNRAIEIDPNSAGAIASRGATYRGMGRYDEALADLNRAIEIDSNSAGAIATRGWTYRLIGRYDEALADFNRAIEIDPNSAGAIAGRGATYRGMGRYDEALADLNRATKLNSQNDWGFYQKSLVLYASGDAKGAKLAVAHAVKLSEEREKRHSGGWRNSLNFAIFHLAAGNETEGRTLIEQAIKAHAPKHLVREFLLDLRELNNVMPQLIGSRELINLLEKHEGSLS